jgi:predicted phage-related endonuclease
MAYGTEQEPIARTAFEQKIGIEFAPMVYANEWQMASLDGINLDGDCILEIKCGEKAYKAAKEGKIPEYYITQMMHAMHVVGCETCHYWAFFKGEGIHIRLESNDAFIKALIEKEEEFYTWIQKKEPNPVWLGHGEN